MLGTFGGVIVELGVFDIDVPDTGLPKEIPIGKEAVKVITYNVNNFNTDGKKQLPNIADWLRKEDPDIVCLQECPVESALRMDSVAKTLSFLPYYCSTRSATKAAGNAIFSKYPILRFESILYPESSNKSLFAVMDIQGDSVRVFNNHFQTTSVNAVKPRLYQAHAEGKQLEETEAAFHMAFQMKKNFVKRATPGGLYPSDVGCRGGARDYLR